MSKILLVEDDNLIADVYRKKLTKAGFEVEVATTGKEALRLAPQGCYDLVLLDMVLPETGGMEVLRALRANERLTQLKIVVFSNLNQTETQQEALREGADGFIGKNDYTPSELVDVLKKMLVELKERDEYDTQGQKKQKHGNGKRILFIEDEKIFLEMFGKKLEDDGFVVTYAENGEWGVREAFKSEFDLVVTDMVMPRLGGEGIVRKLRENSKTKNLPIIVLSASVNQEDLKKVKILGIADFFLKTRIIPSELSHRISEILK